MHWYVLMYNMNSKMINTYDVFDHSGFYNDVKKLLVSDLGVDDFKEKLRRSFQYWFWCRCEFEVLVCGWSPSHKDVEKKIDIYEQVMLNWDVFVDYVFNYME